MRTLSLLLLLLLGAVLLAVGSRIMAQTATPTFPPAVTTAPVMTATPAAIIVATAVPGPTPVPIQANGCYAPLPLTIGGQIFLRGGVNVRNQPTLSGALVNYYSQAVALTLLEGPVCAEGYNWWHVTGSGQPGWVIEGKPGRYLMQQIIDPNTTNCAAPLETIQVGGSLRTVTGSRVHETPDDSSFVVTVVQPGVQLAVTEGPRCFGGLNWWRVRAPYGLTNTLVDGWIAEGYPTDYFVEGLTAGGESAPACFAALRLHNGTRAAVTYENGVPRRLRAAPSTSAGVVAELIDGIAFDVISDESVCADGYNWWQVRILTTGLTGWLAEGRPGSYWFEVLIN